MEWPHHIKAYKVGKVLGYGNEAKVNVAEYKGRIVAIRSCTNDWATFHLDLIETFRHPHIMTIFATWMSPERLYYRVCEYCPYGSLDRYIAKQKQDLTLGQARLVGMQIKSALDYIHSIPFQGESSVPANELQFQHADVKPQNILIYTNDCVKLGDFGSKSGFKWTVDTQFDWPLFSDTLISMICRRVNIEWLISRRNACRKTIHASPLLENDPSRDLLSTHLAGLTAREGPDEFTQYIKTQDFPFTIDQSVAYLDEWCSNGPRESLRVHMDLLSTQEVWSMFR